LFKISAKLGPKSEIEEFSSMSSFSTDGKSEKSLVKMVSIEKWFGKVDAL